MKTNFSGTDYSWSPLTSFKTSKGDRAMKMFSKYGKILFLCCAFLFFIFALSGCDNGEYKYMESLPLEYYPAEQECTQEYEFEQVVLDVCEQRANIQERRYEEEENESILLAELELTLPDDGTRLAVRIIFKTDYDCSEFQYYLQVYNISVGGYQIIRLGDSPISNLRILDLFNNGHPYIVVTSGYSGDSWSRSFTWDNRLEELREVEMISHEISFTNPEQTIFYAKVVAEQDSYGIEIRKEDGSVSQLIHAEPPEDGLPVPLRIYVLDLNNDGYIDIVAHRGGTMNFVHDVFIWSKALQEFVQAIYVGFEGLSFFTVRDGYILNELRSHGYVIRQTLIWSDNYELVMTDEYRHYFVVDSGEIIPEQTYEQLLARQLFAEVLQDKVGFYSSLTGNQSMTLSEHINSFEIPEVEYTFSVTQFLIMELSYSDVPAVVLEISPPYPGDRLILHYNDGRIYGDSRSFRGMREIKTDGSFCWSGGITNLGTSRLRRANGSVEAVITSESIIDRDSNTILFFVHGEQVLECIYNTYREEHYKKDSAKWHEFVVETVVEDFEAAWNDFFDRNPNVIVFERVGDLGDYSGS